MTSAPNGSKGGSGSLSWPMVVLILATGGGNYLATHQGASSNSAETETAIRNVRELHAAVDDFEKRQKEELAHLETLLKGQSSILSEVHSLTVREQMSVYQDAQQH